MKKILLQICAFSLLGLVSITTLFPAAHHLLEAHDHHHACSSDHDQFHSYSDECNLCEYLTGINTFKAEVDDIFNFTPLKHAVLAQRDIPIVTLIKDIRHLRGPPSA